MSKPSEARAAVGKHYGTSELANRIRQALQNADRDSQILSAGMASGLTATTLYIGVLVGVAALGVVLTQIASRRFITGGVEAGLDAETAAELAKHVTSGDVAGIVSSVPEALRASVWSIGNAAFADGFAAAALLAAAVAAAAALLLVRRAETLPVTGGSTEDMDQSRGGSWSHLQRTDRGTRESHPSDLH
jgi:hypothetical protein